MNKHINMTKIRIAAAFAGASALLAEGAVELANLYLDTNGSYRLIESLLAAGMLLTLAAVYELHTRVESPSKPLNFGFAALGGGQLAIGLVAVASAANDIDVLGPVFALGALAWVVGSVTIGVVSLRRRELFMAALPVAMIAAFAVGHGGLVIAGAYWLVIAFRLLAPAPRKRALRAASATA